MMKRGILYFASAVAGIMCAVLLSGIFTVTENMGSGMQPAVESGSTVLVNRIAYRDEIPQVGDVMAIHNCVYGEEGEGSILIRRVAGSQGDTIEIKDDVFYLNGMPYTDHMKEPVHMENIEKYRLKKGQVFLLSDNRKASMDSRDEAIGIVGMRDCIGKVCFK